MHVKGNIWHFCFGDKSIGSWLVTKTYQNRFVWSKWNYRTSFNKKFNYIVRWIWIFFLNNIKNKVANLNVMTMALKFWLVVKFWVWMRVLRYLLYPCGFQNMPIWDNKRKNLQKLHLSIKVVQFDLQKCITWPNNPRKWRQEWSKDWMEFGICPRKFNTPI